MSRSPPSSAGVGPQPLHFLGLELSPDGLRASLVDDSLNLIGVQSVDFDLDLPEFQTQGGIFTTPGDAYTTPVEMWVKALDVLLQRLKQSFDLSKVRGIAGSAQQACVWWRATTPTSTAGSPTAPNPLLRLHPSQPLHTQLHGMFSVPHTPVSQDASTLSQSHVLDASIPGGLATRTGVQPHASLPAAQILKVRETQRDVWIRTSRIQLASAFLASLLAGRWVGMSESEASATGIWLSEEGRWDEEILAIVAGGTAEDVARLRAMLGDVVDFSSKSKPTVTVSSYLVDRYGFRPDAFIVPFISDTLAAYLSVLPTPSDTVFAFGPMDVMMTPAPRWSPSPFYTLLPHPIQEAGEKKRYIATLSSRNGDVPRALVRDMYTKSWSAFDRLVAIVPPGGSIGLDDNLFSFWMLQPDTSCFLKGIFRFETGVKVNEFRDLRANPRCLLESQIISFRVRYARMKASPLFASHHHHPHHGHAHAQQRLPLSLSTTSTFPPSAHPPPPFDPYSTTQLPNRVLAIGAAANFSSVVNLVGDMFNAPVFVPGSQVDAARVVPHRNSPPKGVTSRAAVGCAWVARWVGLGVGLGSGGFGAGSPRVSFEEEVKRLLTGSAATTPTGKGSNNLYGKGYIPSGLAISMPRSATLDDDDDEEGRDAVGDIRGVSTMSSYGYQVPLGHALGQPQVQQQFGYNGASGMNGYDSSPNSGRTRTTTTDSMYSNSSSNVTSSGYSTTPSTAYTSSPDTSILSHSHSHYTSAAHAHPNNAPMVSNTSQDVGHLSALNPVATSGNGSTPPSPPQLTPVPPLPTFSPELEMGLLKVAEPDVDAFMTYASLLPEWCRLEGVLMRGIV